MDDVTLTQLFAKMDAHLAKQDEHLAKQDVHLATITDALQRQNALLLDMSRVLQTTAQQVAEIHASASRSFAGAMHVLSQLVDRLDRP